MSTPPKVGIEPEWMTNARELIGLKEIVGSQHEKRILEFFATAGHAWVKDDETAWCAAFVHAMLASAGVQGTGALNARSYMKWGRPLKEPVIGCIVVFWRNDPKSWEGHVGFYAGKSVSGKIWVLGGNQSNSVSLQLFDPSQVLGYRMPEGVTINEPAPVPTPKPVPRPIPKPPDIEPTPPKPLPQPPTTAGTAAGAGAAAAGGAAIVGAFAFDWRAGLLVVTIVVAVAGGIWLAHRRKGAR